MGQDGKAALSMGKEAAMDRGRVEILPGELLPGAALKLRLVGGRSEADVESRRHADQGDRKQ